MNVEGIAKVIRKQLSGEVGRAKGYRRVAIALSGGVDSCSVLASLVNAGYTPVVISYSPSTHESTDFKFARQTAKNLGLDFVAARVDMSAESLERDARKLISLGYKKKLFVESLTPMLEIQKMAVGAGATALFTGDQSDGFFINANWSPRALDKRNGVPAHLMTKIKYDTDAVRMDILRDEYWNQDKSCSGEITELGRLAGLKVFVPYRNAAIRKAFVGTLWSEINEPRLKEPIHQAFVKEFRPDHIKVRKVPCNLHRGDSYFAVTMSTTLLAQPHLQGPWISPTGLYNAIARGEV